MSNIITTLVQCIGNIAHLVNRHSEEYAWYKHAIRSGYVYDKTGASMGEIAHHCLLKSIVRHTDGESLKYGFHHIINDYHIRNPERFLRYIVKLQSHCPDPWLYDEVKFLLIRN